MRWTSLSRYVELMSLRRCHTTIPATLFFGRVSLVDDNFSSLLRLSIPFFPPASSVIGHSSSFCAYLSYFCSCLDSSAIGNSSCFFVDPSHFFLLSLRFTITSLYFRRSFPFSLLPLRIAQSFSSFSSFLCHSGRREED